MARASAAPSSRTRVKRVHERAVYDRARIDEILDAALICHLGFERDRQPYVIPTLHARIGDLLYVHGSAASRTLRALGEGIPACATVTLLDGIVLARSVFEHSMNYRSVVVLGTATPVVDADEKYSVLEAFTKKLLPGRFADSRPPTRKELKATSVLSLPLDEASAKVRDGAPGRRRHARRRPRRVGRAHPAHRPCAGPRSRRPISAPESRYPPTRSATAVPVLPAKKKKKKPKKVRARGGAGGPSCRASRGCVPSCWSCVLSSRGRLRCRGLRGERGRDRRC